MNLKVLVCVGLLTLSVCGSHAYAEDARLLGVFVSRTPSEKVIAAAIDKSVADFNFIARPIARSRLKKVTPVIGRAEFGRSGSDVWIKLGTNKPSSASPGGPTVKWTRDDGEVLDVGFAWDGATLVQSFKAEDGIRFNRYTLSDDGQTLTVDVTLTSDQLKVPLKYVQVLERATAN